MLQWCSKLPALACALALAGFALAADEKAAPVKLTKLTDVAGGTGGVVSPDGKMLAVTVVERYEKKLPNGGASGSYHRVRLLEAATGKELAVIPGAAVARFSDNGKVLSVQQSFDEQFIKAGNLFGAVAIIPMPQLWDVSNPQKPKQLFVVDSALSESFSPDSKLLLVAGGPEQKFGNAGKVVTGLPKTGNKAGAVGGAPGGVGGIAGGGGLGFGAGISTRFLEIWDVDTAKFVARYEPHPKAKGGVSNPIFSPDAKLVATVVTAQLPKGLNWKIGVYDVDAKKEARQIDLGDAKVMQYGGLFEDQRRDPLQFVPSYRTSGGESSHHIAALLSTNDGIELNLYDPATGKSVATLHQEKKKADGTVQGEFCVSPDGKTVAVLVKHFVNVANNLPGRNPNAAPGAGNFGIAGGAGGGVGFGGGGVPAGGFGIAGGGAGGFGVAGGGAGAFGGVPAGGFPAGGNGGARWYSPPAAGSVILYDLEKRARTHTLNVIPQTGRFANDRSLAVLDFADKAVKLNLWDVATGQEIGRVPQVDQVQFSRDGASMVTRSTDANSPGVRAWTVESKK